MTKINSNLEIINIVEKMFDINIELVKDVHNIAVKLEKLENREFQKNDMIVDKLNEVIEHIDILEKRMDE
jgi:hypothetical protein